MGLLDDLLAGAKQGAGRESMNQSPPPRASGGDMRTVLMALMPVVLAMLANRRTSTSQAGSGHAAGGGLGDLLGSLLGGAGAGGLGDLLGKFQRAGFGEQAQSWVNRGQNQPLPPNAIEQVFGHDGVAQIARHAGLSEADASRGLSQLLPEIVDNVTPDGNVPAGDALVASVEALGRRYGVA